MKKFSNKLATIIAVLWALQILLFAQIACCKPGMKNHDCETEKDEQKISFHHSLDSSLLSSKNKKTMECNHCSSATKKNSNRNIKQFAKGKVFCSCYFTTSSPKTFLLTESKPDYLLKYPNNIKKRFASTPDFYKDLAAGSFNKNQFRIYQFYSYENFSLFTLNQAFLI